MLTPAASALLTEFGFSPAEIVEFNLANGGRLSTPLTIVDREDLAQVHRNGPRAIIPTFVYLVAQDRELMKIGITTNLKSRLSGLQTANPYKLELLAWSLPMKAWRARLAESGVHEVLQDARITGEWFRCNATTAVECMAGTGGIEIDRASPVLPYDPSAE